MKITVQTKEFQDALTKLLKVAVKKSTLRILEGVKIEATSAGVVLTATDADTFASIMLKECIVSNSGAIVIEKGTINLIQKMKSNELTMTNNKITAGRMEVSFSSLDAEDFPNNEHEWGKYQFTVPMQRLLEIIDVRYACGTNYATPIMMGVLFRGNQVIGCDRHRLAVKEFPEYSAKQDMVIPASALNFIPLLADKKYKDSAAVIVDDTDGYVNIQYDNVTIQARLLDGTYPDVSKIMPKQSSCTITVNKADLLDELNLMKGSTTKENRAIKFKIEKDSITLIVDNAVNKLQSQLSILQSGDSLTIAFDINYLIEGLKHISKKDVTFAFTGKLTPAMIDDEHLVLPLRVA